VVRVYGSSQLGSDENMMQRLRLGTIDLSLPSTVMSSAVPVFGLFEMPYLVQDREHMARIRDEIVMPKMAPQAEAAGYRILAVWENGFRHITNNVRPIVTPQDLAGIKLRVPGGEWRVRMFEAYGANPSPMALSEVFVALQTGVMDGQENPYAQIYPSRFYEVQRYLSNTRHVYTPAYVVAGASWGRMDPEVQRSSRRPRSRCRTWSTRSRRASRRSSCRRSPKPGWRSTSPTARPSSRRARRSTRRSAPGRGRRRAHRAGPRPRLRVRPSRADGGPRSPSRFRNAPTRDPAP
jgi:tripartite ATP-independent transporter DctP family solute receptor